MKGEPLPANISLFDIMVKVKFIVFNATFYNISVISRRSVLLVEEIESLEKNTPTCRRSLIKFTT